jgi:arsenate reductase-like glutaredoxin family protein
MNILILGCSFGTANYANIYPGFPPHTHTEFLLKNLGHNVYNCSLYGSSNLQTIEQADAFLNGKALPYEPYNYSSNLAKTPTNIDLISVLNKQVLENILSKIDQIYKQIKKNEETPKTEYLFAGLERENNFDKSMRRLDALNAADNLFSKTNS